MKERMKVMIAYDGSGCADATIDDLRHAGLPPTGEVLVVSVADISKTAIADSYELSVLGKFVSSRLLEETVALTEMERARARNETKKLAKRGGERVRSKLPGWRVNNIIAIGNPAEELLREADAWQPDLIVVGSHGRSAIGRFFLGSVSQIVAEGASCSVRVAHCGFEKNADAPNKIIVGAGSLSEAERLIQAVGGRVWSDETEARLIKVSDGVPDFCAKITAMLEQSAGAFHDAGLKATVEVRSGDPKSILLEEAEKWRADAIFTVAGGTNEEPHLSETAAGLITETHCTVEVVR